MFGNLLNSEDNIDMVSKNEQLDTQILLQISSKKLNRSSIKITNNRFKQVVSANYDNQVGYTSLQGYPDSRKAISRLSHSCGDDVFILSGLNHARWLLTELFIEHNDSVLVHSNWKPLWQCLVNAQDKEVNIIEYQNYEDLLSKIDSADKLKVVFVGNPDLYNSENYRNEQLLKLCELANTNKFALGIEEPFYFLKRDLGYKVLRSSIVDVIGEIRSDGKYSDSSPIFLLSQLENGLFVDNQGFAWIDLLNNVDSKFDYVKKGIQNMSSFFLHPSTFVHPAITQLFSNDFDNVENWQEDLTQTFVQNFENLKNLSKTSVKFCEKINTNANVKQNRVRLSLQGHFYIKMEFFVKEDKDVFLNCVKLDIEELKRAAIPDNKNKTWNVFQPILSLDHEKFPFIITEIFK